MKRLFTTAALLICTLTSSYAEVSIVPGQVGSYRVEWDGLVVELSVTGPVDEIYEATWRLSENGTEVATNNEYDIFRLFEAPSVKLVELDPANDQPELLVTNFTGGAHCCTQVVVHTKTANGWKPVDLGAFDGGSLLSPEDMDGDGAAEFKAVDDRFLYEFASYAGSAAPPMILAVRGGEKVDITRDPAFEWTLRSALDDLGTIPESGEERNSWLAAYAATLVLLGEADPLDYASSAYDPAPDWGMITCKVEMQDGVCPDGQQERLQFPEALTRFLTANGYLEAR